MAGRDAKADVNNIAKKSKAEVTQISTTDRHGGKTNFKLLHGKNIARPQMKFKDRIDNSSTVPFERKIAYKPHAKVPLEKQEPITDTFIVSGIPPPMPHPYSHEIETITYPDHLFQSRDPIHYSPILESEAKWIDTEVDFDKMLDEIEGSTELAIDLEHHDYRSFQGFTCLLQLSTRSQDYIVDTLELRHYLWKLNEYFADPSIVKILHGAKSDIIWLQRDFGLYIVDLFDTYDATHVLDFPHHSLAYLLKRYCNVDADKKYQLADWRIRPLPEEMIKYARADTHYLLYIYDRLREELLAGSINNENLLRSVLQRSSLTSSIVHEKEPYDAENGLGAGGWYNLLVKWKHPMTSQQLAVFKALHHWRDTTARQEDESIRYVLPNHMLFTLVERMPIDSPGVIGCCNPCPPSIKMNAQVIAMLIQRTKMEAIMQEKDKEKKPTLAAMAGIDTNPHHLHHTSSPTTNNNNKISSINVKEKVDPSVFDLEKVYQQRQQLVDKFATDKSILFGNENDLTLDKEAKDAQTIANHIRATFTIAIPFNDLKIKAIHDHTSLQKQSEKALQQENQNQSETPDNNNNNNNNNDDGEHIYTQSKDRETKKRQFKDKDVLTVGNYGRKPSKKKSKK
ncbi:unnamed protein product [Cunninghamella blakesleeana]